MVRFSSGPGVESWAFTVSARGQQGAARRFAVSGGAILATIGLLATSCSSSGGGNTAQTSSSTPTASSAAPASPADTLMSHLPKGYTAADCQPGKPAGAAATAVAELTCGANHKDGGPGSMFYDLYPNSSALDAAFGDWVHSRLTVQPFPDKSPGPKPWSSGGNHGSVALATSRRNLVYLVWSNEATLILGVSSTMSDAPTLYNWWQANR